MLVFNSTFIFCSDSFLRVDKKGNEFVALYGLNVGNDFSKNHTGLETRMYGSNKFSAFWVFGEHDELVKLHEFVQEFKRTHDRKYVFLVFYKTYLKIYYNSYKRELCPCFYVFNFKAKQQDFDHALYLSRRYLKTEQVQKDEENQTYSVDNDLMETIASVLENEELYDDIFNETKVDDDTNDDIISKALKNG